MDTRPIVRVVVAGSVDDGKSTLLGRLLFDTDSILDDQLSAVRRASDASGEEATNLALLTDGLRAERAQKITIDVAYRHFSTSRRRILLADTPGHEQYTRNMLTGASTADAAILLLDASRGITEQSLRHAYITAMLLVPRVLVAVNKMDLVGFDEAAFGAIVEQFRAQVGSLHLPLTFLPVSAREGDNVAARGERMPWYRGPTLLEYLDEITPNESAVAAPFRFPIQLAIRPNASFRGYAGTPVSGSISVGEPVRVIPSGVTSRIAAIHGTSGSVERCEAGDAIVVELEDEIGLHRGDMLVRPREVPSVLSQIDLEVCVTGGTELRAGKRVLIRHLLSEVPAQVAAVRDRLEPGTMERGAADSLQTNDIGRIELRAAVAMPIEPFRSNRSTGGVVLIDPATNEILAAGVATGIETPNDIVREHPRVVWLTGLSGAGKSTLSKMMVEELQARNVPCVILDGDDLRSGLNRDLGFDEAGRTENIRRTAEIARLLASQGVWVVCALISPLASQRELARSIVGEIFVEAYIRCSLDEVARRDPKGLYRRAMSGELRSFTGISSPYEVPDAPDIVIDTEMLTPSECLRRLTSFLIG
ncbi:adenylyl-sulfate kinase [Fimbriimonas ginsengisoli]|uniref:Adenylyl-sulfate kinase n=1 Tax=Fimbriimonas ginsengisoli Gsoil 348 TaxID=661478 RepID=A0A068NXV7_FIMGI|nr:adenylyl-sulfate kinase [Fimbriimonas ginsengisoli]AIE86484.1 sulfate adenylyltransferase large subunit [Fimbriimonas ginsengisoli Gsoil 348]